MNEFLSLEDTPFQRYLQGIEASHTHNGYFSIDKKTKRLVDPKTRARSNETDDVDAYDLILRNKEQLLWFDEPTRFIFSHSALREGWDNPNVFVICTLKHSDSSVSRRQEVGRGLRLAVNQGGERMDDPATVHQTNVLTVVASESYRDFVGGLQKDINAALSARPRLADDKYFVGKTLKGDGGETIIDNRLATQIRFYLLQNGYIDFDKQITAAYQEAKQTGTLADLPPDLTPYKNAVFALVDGLFSESQLPAIENARARKQNPLNDNFKKKEFQALWRRINRKAAYTVHFDSEELVDKSIVELDKQLRVTTLQYRVTAGEQKDQVEYDELRRGDAFRVRETTTERYATSAQSAVSYDLIGHIAEETQLTRRTVARILAGINSAVFAQYRTKPEDFLIRAARLINEQKATMIVEHLAYDAIDDQYDLEIFTQEKPPADFSKALKADRHIYDYVFTDSSNERAFVSELDTSSEVVVYAKLPRGFFIPTPLGNYNPDWAIAFQQDKVRHVYFVAETKGSLSSLELRAIEKGKIDCARKFFSSIAADNIKYDVVDNFDSLLNLVS